MEISQEFNNHEFNNCEFVLPIDVVIEIARLTPDMFVFGALVRVCRAIWGAFATLTRRVLMARFMTWRVRECVFGTKAYYEYHHNGVPTTHLIKLRYDAQGRVVRECEMWLGRKWGRYIAYYSYDERDSVAAPYIRTRARYVSGVRHGRLQEYHECGVLWYDCTYYHGQLHGEFRAWYDNGRLQQIKHYAHGVAIGAWIEYDRDGGVVASGDNPANARRRCVML